jgi:hypothetical protein
MHHSTAKKCRTDNASHRFFHLHARSPRRKAQESGEEVSKMNNCIPLFLEFHVFNTVHLVTVIVTVNIDNNGQATAVSAALTPMENSVKKTPSSCPGKECG